MSKKEINKFLKDETMFSLGAIYKIEPAILLSLYSKWIQKNYTIVKKDKK